jgi:hypothetical protein
VRKLHRAWLLAQAAGLIAVTGGKAAADVVSLPDADDAVISWWLEALLASAAAEYGQRPVPLELLVSCLAIVAEDPAAAELAGFGD